MLSYRDIVNIFNIGPKCITVAVDDIPGALGVSRGQLDLVLRIRGVDPDTADTISPAMFAKVVDMFRFLETIAASDVPEVIERHPVFSLEPEDVKRGLYVFPLKEYAAARSPLCASVVLPSYGYTSLAIEMIKLPLGGCWQCVHHEAPRDVLERLFDCDDVYLIGGVTHVVFEPDSDPSWSAPRVDISVPVNKAIGMIEAATSAPSCAKERIRAALSRIKSAIE